MNKGFGLTLMLIVLSLAVAAQPEIDHVSVDPQEPFTQQEVEIYAESSHRTEGLIMIQIDTGNGFSENTKYCDGSATCEYNLTGVSAPSNQGEWEIKVRSQDNEGVYSNEFIEKVSVSEAEEPSLNLENVEASRYDIEEGESTTLRAEVSNDGSLGGWAHVKWFAGENVIGAAGKNVPADDSVEIERKVSYSELEKELDKGIEYELSAELNSEQSVSSSKSLKLIESEEEPLFEIKSVEASEYEIEEGGSTTLQATVSNSGEPEYVSVRWLANDIWIGNANKRIPEGESRTVERTVSYSGLRDEGLETEKDYELSADLIGKDVERSSGKNLRLIEPEDEAFFSVQSVSADPVTEGEVMEVEYEVKNIGDSYGSREVELYVDNEKKDDITQGLGGGNSAEGALEWQTEASDGGSTYEVKISTGDDQKAIDVEVFEEDTGPQPSLDKVYASNYHVDPGETTTLKADLSNSGDENAFVSLEWSSESRLLGSGSKQIPAGGEASIERKKSFNDLSDVLEAGECHDFSGEMKFIDQRQTENAPQQLCLGEEDEPNFQVDILDVNSPVEGDPIEIEWEVENTGEASGVQSVERMIEGLESSTTNSIELDSSDSYSETWTVDTSESDAGTYDIKFETDDDTAEDQVTVLEEEELYTLDVEVSSDGEPLEDAKVKLNSREEFTDSDGEASFPDLPSGDYDVKVSKDGYRTEIRQDVSVDRDREIYVELQEIEDDAPFFDVSILDVNSPVEGDPIEIEWEVVNTGEALAIQTINREIDLESSETGLISLDPSESYSETWTVDTSEGDAGSYGFTLESEEDVASGTVTVREEDEDVKADFSFEPLNPEPGEDVVFDASDSSGEIDSYSWDFGDGNQGEGIEVTHSYESAGTYEVELEASGATSDKKTRTVTVSDDEPDEFNLDVTVRESDTDDPVEDARVSIAGRTVETDSDGNADFTLERGLYDLFVSRTGYLSESREVEMDRNRGLDIYLERDTLETGDIVIDSLEMDSSVCRGDSIDARVNLRNEGEASRTTTLSASGLSNEIDRRLSFEGGETKTRTVSFLSVTGSGNEEVEFTTGDDSRTKTVQVRDCDLEEEAITVNARPSQVRIGDSIRVSGYADNVDRNTQVDIYVGGRLKGSTETRPDGYYQKYVNPDRTGDQTVRVEASGAEGSTRIDVLPTVRVNSASTPYRVFEGDSYEVCADVESQVAPLVVLKKDGEEVDSQYGRGEVCFERRSSPGDYSYEVEAWARGQRSSKSTGVEVLEMDSEARSFPDQIASVRSGSGLAKVELYNTREDLERYDVEISGVPDDWVSQSRKELFLDTGERETAYIYFTPKREGSFEAELSVSAGSEEIYTENIRLRSGGSDRPPEKGLLERIGEILGLTGR